MTGIVWSVGYGKDVTAGTSRLSPAPCIVRQRRHINRNSTKKGTREVWGLVDFKTFPATSHSTAAETHKSKHNKEGTRKVA